MRAIIEYELWSVIPTRLRSLTPYMLISGWKKKSVKGFAKTAISPFSIMIITMLLLSRPWWFNGCMILNRPLNLQYAVVVISFEYWILTKVVFRDRSTGKPANRLERVCISSGTSRWIVVISNAADIRVLWLGKWWRGVITKKILGLLKDDTTFYMLSV